MMGLESIRDMADEAGRKAEKEAMTPHVFISVDAAMKETADGFPFPSIGSYEPEGWTERERLFCDASGFGRSSEPAMTARALRARIVTEVADHRGRVGFAIVEVGQFQLYVGIFDRV
jgi:hypothetical protein